MHRVPTLEEIAFRATVIARNRRHRIAGALLPEVVGGVVARYAAARSGATEPDHLNHWLAVTLEHEVRLLQRRTDPAERATG